MWCGLGTQARRLQSALAAWVPGMLICDLRLKSHCQGLPRNHDLGCSPEPESLALCSGRTMHFVALLRKQKKPAATKTLPAFPLCPAGDLSAEVQSLADW